MSNYQSVLIERAVNLSLMEIEEMPLSEKRDCFDVLQEYCRNLKQKYHPEITLTQRVMAKCGPKFRKFPLEITGQTNVPLNGCLIVCNHSNTHDAFVMAEALMDVGVPCTFLAAIEGLSFVELSLFKSAKATMINRTDKQSSVNGLYDFTGKLIHGDTGVIFGESTWNLHPYKLMQKIKIGSVKTAAIANVPIVPMIMEYVEVPDICMKEKDLYKKCVVKFGKPISIDRQESLIEQNNQLQSVLENMRLDIWKNNGTVRRKKEDVNPRVYVNHTWLKKFGSPLFDFDSEKENKLVYVNKGDTVENEWHLNRDEVFEPGIISKTDRHF